MEQAEFQQLLDKLGEAATFWTIDPDVMGAFLYHCSDEQWERVLEVAHILLAKTYGPLLEIMNGGAHELRS